MICDLETENSEAAVSCESSIWPLAPPGHDHPSAAGFCHHPWLQAPHRVRGTMAMATGWLPSTPAPPHPAYLLWSSHIGLHY